jgi:SWI/SNF-related matrix-associated actin-dependent regulator of chromatin subfamily A member 5
MPHQIGGVTFLHHLRRNNANGILADEMGLGKTLQVLSFFQLIINVEKSDGRPFLVVCPLSVLDSWAAETNTKTKMRAASFHGNENTRKSIGRLVKNRGI